MKLIRDNGQRLLPRDILDEARALGYQPEDDAEVFAPELIAEHGEPALLQRPVNLRLRRLALQSQRARERSVSSNASFKRVRLVFWSRLSQ